MNKLDEQALVAAWIERYEKQYSADAAGVLQQRDVNWAAWQQLDNLVHESPKDALRVAIRIARTTKTNGCSKTLVRDLSRT
jgi:hypothetical protein